jgi:Meiotically up-regulated gene 113
MAQGFHSLYLVVPASKTALKVGIARDPEQRLRGLQNANFEKLQFHRFWWLAGLPIAARIEKHFKENFAPAVIRGEWFDVSPQTAEDFVLNSIQSLQTWGIGQDEMLKLMEQSERRRIEQTLDQIKFSHRSIAPLHHVFRPSRW